MKKQTCTRSKSEPYTILFSVGSRGKPSIWSHSDHENVKRNHWFVWILSLFRSFGLFFASSSSCFSAVLFVYHIIHFTIRVLCVLPLWHFHLNTKLSQMCMFLCALVRTTMCVTFRFFNFSLYLLFNNLSIISATSFGWQVKIKLALLFLVR